MSLYGNATEVASLYAKLGADVSDFNNSMKRAEGVFGKMASGVASFAKMGVTAAIGGIGLLGSGFAAATKVGMDFEKTMSGAGAVLQANGDTMQRLSDLALQIGKDTSFGASEAAGAIEMLAKNGLSAEQIIGGAATATVALAAATGADLATAADISTDALAQFGLGVGDLDRAINGITGVVVSSKFGINDYALALAQAGGVAGKIGVSFEDFNTAIAATSSSFASGSDAGTSFKTFLQRLPGISGPAIDALAELGIITEDGQNQFFDANGQMKSMAQIAGILQRSLAGLSDEAKTSLLSDAFGTDAIRTALGLASVGEAGFNALAGQIAGVNAGAQASQRLDNLAGDVEQLGGSFETLGIKVAKAFDPQSRRAVQFFTAQINKLLDWDWNRVARGFERVFDSFTSPMVRRAIDRVAVYVGDFARSIERIAGPAFATTTRLVGLFFEALASGQNVFSHAGFVNELASVWARMRDTIAGAAPQVMSALVDLGFQIMSWGGQSLGIIVEAAKLWGSALWGWVEPQVPVLLGHLGNFWNWLTSWATDPERRSTLFEAVASTWDGFTRWASFIWGNVVEQLGNFWRLLTSWITDEERRRKLFTSIANTWTGFAQWGAGVWSDIVPGLVASVNSMNTWLDQNAPALASWRDAFIEFFEGTSRQFEEDTPKWSKRWTEFKDSISEDARRILEAFTGIGDGFEATFGQSGVFARAGQFFGAYAFFLADTWMTVVETIFGGLRGLVEYLTLSARLSAALIGRDWAQVAALTEQFQSMGSSWVEDRDNLFQKWAEWWDRSGELFNFGGSSSDNSGAAPGANSRVGIQIDRIEVNISAGADVGQARALADDIAARIWRNVEMAGGRI